MERKTFFFVFFCFQVSFIEFPDFRLLGIEKKERYFIFKEKKKNNKIINRVISTEDGNKTTHIEISNG